MAAERTVDGYIAALPDGPRHVNFGFWRGVEVAGDLGILETTGSEMAHVKLHTAQDINRSALARLVKRAVQLNREKGDPTRTR